MNIKELSSVALLNITPYITDVQHLPLKEQGVFAHFTHPDIDLEIYLCGYDPETNMGIGFTSVNGILAYDKFSLSGMESLGAVREENFSPCLASLYSNVSQYLSLENPYEGNKIERKDKCSKECRWSATGKLNASILKKDGALIETFSSIMQNTMGSIGIFPKIDSSAYKIIERLEKTGLAKEVVIDQDSFDKKLAEIENRRSSDTEELRLRIGNKRKEEMRAMLIKKRLDLVERGEIEATIDAIEAFGEEEAGEKGDSKLEKLALHWTIKSGIRLPEDGYAVRQAAKIATIKGVDPMSFDNPKEIIDKYAGEVKGERLDPDKETMFTDRQEVPGTGIVTYLVNDSFSGQEAVRRMIDTHWGKDANPWCLAARIDDNLKQAKTYWDEYNAYPKRIAFKDGKLLAFSANDSNDVVWWDRQDVSHDGIPATIRLSEGRRQEVVYNTSGEIIKKGVIEQGNKENGTYRSWHSNGQLEEESTYKDGKLDGISRIWYDNGQLRAEPIYKDGKLDGISRIWYDNGQLRAEPIYKDGKIDGLYRGWHSNGQLNEECTYKDGKLDGISRRWHSSGQLYVECTYKDGELDGTSRSWHSNGQSEVECTYKDGKLDGISRRWYENGQLYEEFTYKDGKRDGIYRRWHSNGQLNEESTYKDGKLDGIYRRWYASGGLREEVRYLSTSSGDVYGFVVDGVVYLNPSKLDVNTPLHEFAHLWNDMVRRVNPKLWEEGKRLVMSSAYWEEVNSNRAYASLSDEAKVDEALAMAIADKGERTIDLYGMPIAIMRSWAQKVWTAIKEFFGVRHEMSIERLSDMALSDLLGGKSLMEGIDSENDDVRYRKYYGGNSGYVGYSMSKRAAEAREDGRYPKTDFKRTYKVSDKSLSMLADIGVISNDEWHHTSMYGNKTTFYSWGEEYYASAYLEQKKEIDTMAKEYEREMSSLKQREAYTRSLGNDIAWIETRREIDALKQNFEAKVKSVLEGSGAKRMYDLEQELQNYEFETYDGSRDVLYYSSWYEDALEANGDALYDIATSDMSMEEKVKRGAMLLLGSEERRSSDILKGIEKKKREAYGAISSKVWDSLPREQMWKFSGDYSVKVARTDKVGVYDVIGENIWNRTRNRAKERVEHWFKQKVEKEVENSFDENAARTEVKLQTDDRIAKERKQLQVELSKYSDRTSIRATNLGITDKFLSFPICKNNCIVLPNSNQPSFRKQPEKKKGMKL